MTHVWLSDLTDIPLVTIPPGDSAASVVPTRAVTHCLLPSIEGDGGSQAQTRAHVLWLVQHAMV